MDCRAEGEGSPSVTGSIDGEACLLFSLFSSLLSQVLSSSWKRAKWLSWTSNRRSSKLRRCPGGLAPSAAFGSRSSLANLPPTPSPARTARPSSAQRRQTSSLYPCCGRQCLQSRVHRLRSDAAFSDTLDLHASSSCSMLTNERRRCELHCMEACFTITFGTKRPCIPTRDVICAPVRVRRSERTQE